MLNKLQPYVEQCIDKYQIPALSLAVWKDGQLYQAAAGCLNRDTGVEATTDSIFHIGSITKVLTACLVMRLVEQGRLALDAPVKQYLRRFQLANTQAAATITVRQLLNHTNGIAGDFFPDDVREEGPHIARYVDRCAQLPLAHPVGEGFSYSNAAYAIAGHLVEVVTGMSWYDAIEEWIFQPLGMRYALCRPQYMNRFRVALGHIADLERPGQWRTTPENLLTLGQAPAGSTVAMRAADLITFGRAHWDSEVIAHKDWLNKTTLQIMQTPDTPIPAGPTAISHSMGLGWFCGAAADGQQSYVGHNGATSGQLASLRVFPKAGVCCAVLMNSQANTAFNTIVERLTREAVGLDLTPPAIDTKAVNLKQLQACVGRYQQCTVACDCRLENGTLILRVNDTADINEPAQEWTLYGIGDQCYELRTEANTSLGYVRFLNPDGQGNPQALFYGMRLYTRQA